ncbi:hypothetical protein D3C86_1224950 [compost metagenome]
MITHYKRHGNGTIDQDQQLFGQQLRILGTMFGTQLAHVVEQLLFVVLGDQANGVLRVAGFAAGVDERAAAKAFGGEPGLEHGKQVEQAIGRGFGLSDFASVPEHPALVAALQGGDGQLLLVGEVAVDAFSGDAGGLHQKIHARGGDATFVDQLFGDIQNDVACVVASDFVHVANSRTIVLLGQAVIYIACAAPSPAAGSHM